jgi:hypothetical protein
VATSIGGELLRDRSCECDADLSERAACLEAVALEPLIDVEIDAGEQ